MAEQLALLQTHFDTALGSPDGNKKLRELIPTSVAAEIPTENCSVRQL